MSKCAWVLPAAAPGTRFAAHVHHVFDLTTETQEGLLGVYDGQFRKLERGYCHGGQILD